MTADRLRVVIADDHPAFLEGLQALLTSSSQIEVVGRAATGTEAIRVVMETGPDVVVLDLHMPEMSGSEATRRIVRSAPGVAVLILTMHEDDDSIFASLRAGAHGYVLKGAGRDELTRAVLGVGAGEAVFGQGIAQRILTYFSPGTRPPAPPLPELTDREREVLDLLAQGHGNVAIAQRLFLSQKTVRNHVSNVFTKLHVADRAEAALRAREAGLGRNDPPR
jgi:DNA-binding NarL/FixJ family response regulator